MNNVANKRNIYSGDLEKYFDQVSIRAASEALYYKFNVPWLVCSFLEDCHKAFPTNVNFGPYLAKLEKMKLKRSDHPTLPEYNLLEYSRN
jgi:hypothetical protein